MPDQADERRHPESAEDDAHGPAERADADAARDGRPQTEALARQRADGPQRQVDAAPDEHGRDRGVEQALGDVVGDERSERPPRRSTAAPSTPRCASRPARSRAWLTAPDAAAAAEIAMFVPAAASGLPLIATISGSRSVPSTSPSIEPR